MSSSGTRLRRTTHDIDQGCRQASPSDPPSARPAWARPYLPSDGDRDKKRMMKDHALWRLPALHYPLCPLALPIHVVDSAYSSKESRAPPKLAISGHCVDSLKCGLSASSSRGKLSVPQRSALAGHEPQFPTKEATKRSPSTKDAESGSVRTEPGTSQTRRIPARKAKSIEASSPAENPLTRRPSPDRRDTWDNSRPC
jgi:hypothetical protein